MIELLKRPEGATVEQIAAATGWQHHTIRGAISGALKKKLGLTVEATAPARSAPTRSAPRAAARSIGSSNAAPPEGACDDRWTTQAPGLPPPRARQPRGRGPAHRAGPHPRRPRPGPCRAGAHRRHRHPDHRRHQRRRRVRHRPRGLAAGRAHACAEPFIPLLWLQVVELLGRVPKGSTAKFLKDGIVPD